MPNTKPVPRIDIVSDIVCPWCIVGYRQLESALRLKEMTAEIHWHPFELNPDMPAQGQNLLEHIAEKYGMTEQQSQENRQHLINTGQSLGFSFNYHDSSRMLNTFLAHQLLHWADLQAREHELKLALFEAYFSEQANISDISVLLKIVSKLGLDSESAKTALDQQTYAAAVREREAFWTSRGVQGVPAMVISQRYLLSGAQGIENYSAMLDKITEMATQENS